MLDSVDIQIVKALQDDLPLTSRPFATIADKIGIEEADVIHRLNSMRSSGKLRRIGGILNHRKSGISANAMVVYAVEYENIDRVGQALAGIPYVTHCYHRDSDDPQWPYTLFAMVHGPTEEICDTRIKALGDQLGINDYAVLMSTRELKKVSMRYFSEEFTLCE